MTEPSQDKLMPTEETLEKLMAARTVLWDVNRPVALALGDAIHVLRAARPTTDVSTDVLVEHSRQLAAMLRGDTVTPDQFPDAIEELCNRIEALQRSNAELVRLLTEARIYVDECFSWETQRLAAEIDKALGDKTDA